MSHTVKMKVAFGDLGALQTAVETMGGTWIGAVKDRRLYQTCETGNAWQLPGWWLPCVLRADGTVAFDDYNGHWGNAHDLEILKDQYAVAIAETWAREQGYYTERTDAGLSVYCPDGEVITIEGAAIAVACGQGKSCQELTAELERRLGSIEQRTELPEAAELATIAVRS